MLGNRNKVNTYNKITAIEYHITAIAVYTALIKILFNSI